MRVLSIIEALIYCSAACFAMYRATCELIITINESEPSSISMERFAEQYQGQQWIQVRGRVAVEQRFVRQSNHQAHRDKNLIYITVPIVPEHWEQVDPVHVVATFGPIPRNQLDSWDKRWSGRSVARVDGQLRPSPFRDPQSMFPELSLGDPFVVINEGTEPKNAFTMTMFFALMVVTAWIAVVKIRRLLKARRVNGAKVI